MQKPAIFAMKLPNQSLSPLATAALCLASSGYVLSQADHTDYHESLPPKLPYATNIFNTINAAMKQWDSSVLHNGMSFFLATVPKGVQFYHGGESPEPPQGLEWLAFEAEHAMGFARPPNYFPAPPPLDYEGQPPSKGQKPLVDLEAETPKPPSNYGYLQTFVTNKQLRLLYIDGMSAAKSGIGTMDSANIVILNNTYPPSKEFQEYQKAQAMCDIAQNEWNGRIDGFLRMEAGFEIILCSFKDDLDTVRITPSKPLSQNNATFYQAADIQYLKAITSRYPGIGEDLVQLDFGQFVTAYEHAHDLFPNDSIYPRLTSVPDDEIDIIRRKVWHLAQHGEVDPSAFNWQAVTERIVTRYADLIEALVLNSAATNKAFFNIIEAVLQPFITYDESTYVDSTIIEQTTERCARQFIPSYAPMDTLAGAAVYGVSYKICSTLASVFFHERHHDELPAALERIRALKDELAWPEWKKCRGCAVDEICMIPMWPLGRKEDYEHPHCITAEDFSWWGDYWGPLVF